MENPYNNPVTLTDRWRTSNLIYIGKKKAKKLDWHIGQELICEQHIEDGVLTIRLAPPGKQLNQQ